MNVDTHIGKCFNKAERTAKPSLSESPLRWSCPGSSSISIWTGFERTKTVAFMPLHVYIQIFCQNQHRRRVIAQPYCCHRKRGSYLRKHQHAWVHRMDEWCHTSLMRYCDSSKQFTSKLELDSSSFYFFQKHYLLWLSFLWRAIAQFHHVYNENYLIIPVNTFWLQQFIGFISKDSLLSLETLDQKQWSESRDDDIGWMSCSF